MGRRDNKMSEINKKDYTEVAVAVIRRGTRVLIAKRPKDKAFAGKWEFPGESV